MNKNDTKRRNIDKKGLVDPSKIVEYPVHRECELLEFLFEHIKGQSKKNIKHILSNHQVAVDGMPVTQFDYRLYPEDTVIVSRNRINSRKAQKIKIIYEDEKIIVIDKPSGLLSVASDREKGKTAYRMVSEYVKAKNPKARIFVVHRLDEDTSGVLMFAKDFATKTKYQDNWQSLVKKRGYYAVVEGHMEQKQATFKDYLAQNDLQLVYITNNKKNGKLATTSYTVLEEGCQYSLLDIDIASGRKNQIRVQLGSRGHHVLGDDKYGEPDNPLNRLALHAYELKIKDPFSEKVYSFKSPMPKEFKSVLNGQNSNKPNTTKKPKAKKRR